MVIDDNEVILHVWWGLSELLLKQWYIFLWKWYGHIIQCYVIKQVSNQEERNSVGVMIAGNASLLYQVIRVHSSPTLIVPTLMVLDNITMSSHGYKDIYADVGGKLLKLGLPWWGNS